MKIKVKAKIGGTTHGKYGLLEEDKEYPIDVKDFGDQLFHEPEGAKHLESLNAYRESLKAPENIEETEELAEEEAGEAEDAIEDPPGREALILAAMKQVLEDGKELTNDDKPEVDAVTRFAGFKVKATERDALMPKLKDEEVTGNE